MMKNYNSKKQVRNACKIPVPNSRLNVLCNSLILTLSTWFDLKKVLLCMVLSTDLWSVLTKNPVAMVPTTPPTKWTAQEAVGSSTVSCCSKIFMAENVSRPLNQRFSGEERFCWHKVTNSCTICKYRSPKVHKENWHYKREFVNSLCIRAIYHFTFFY